MSPLNNIMKPNVLVLKADGINCDSELAFAFTLAGGNVKIVHINELRSKYENLKKYHILAIPGGFSYGDDIVSGKILSVELTSFFSEELKKFMERRDTTIIGICNGFQVLIRTGLLPLRSIGKMDATLTNNDSGHFECRWVNLKIEKNTSCVFLRHPDILSFQVAHGEGKFFAKSEQLQRIEDHNLVVFRYCDALGNPTQEYPSNPNGSLNAIAGICDSTGRILGLMPHPERFVRKTQHPNWRRMGNFKPEGLRIFEKMVNYAAQM